MSAPNLLDRLRAKQAELSRLKTEPASTLRPYRHDPEQALCTFLAEHPELNNPADVAALIEYFRDPPPPAPASQVYADELREAVPDELQ